MRDNADIHTLACSIAACVVSAVPSKSLLLDTLEEMLHELGRHDEEQAVWETIKKVFQAVENPLGVLYFPDLNELYRRAPDMLLASKQALGNDRFEIIERHVVA